MSLETRLKTVQDKIRTACEEAGRQPNEVQLIAVSKTRPANAIETALKLGHIHYGENYAQELRDKVKLLKLTVHQCAPRTPAVTSSPARGAAGS